MTLDTFTEKTPTRVEDFKARLTIFACADAAGTHKCKLFVIGKNTGHQEFKGVKCFPSYIMQIKEHGWQKC
ncbi:MAG: hypothetical protein E7Y34_02445 [Mycoplasma sp.]|nr:hypothetical protein [Mycoplasma sp.]